MAKKDQEVETSGFVEEVAVPVEAEKVAAPKKAKEPSTSPAPAAAAGMVLCKIHTGWYQDDTKLLGVGAEVLVPADEVGKLAHCLAPIKE